MFSRIWNCAKRHRKKLIFISAFFGGSWLAFHWLQRKVRELRDQQDQVYLERLRRQQHFDSNQRTCNMTVLSMLPNLRGALSKELNTESITHLLQNSPANKLVLWDQLKIATLARAVCGVYGCCLMSLLLRVQLNLIGGYLYLDTSVSKPEQDEMPIGRRLIPQSVQEHYLALIGYFLSTGLSELSKFVGQVTSKEVGGISLKEDMTLDHLQSIFNAIREHVECGRMELCQGPPTLPLCHYVLPGEQVPDIEVKSANELLYDKLLKETRDILESSDFHLVLQESLDRGFSRLMDSVAENYRLQMTTKNCKVSLHEITVPMAKILPVVDNVINKMCCDAPNPFVQELLLLEQMKNLAANIYEAFSQSSLQA